MMTRKIMVVPCMVKTWLYWLAERMWPLGRASCRRMSSASQPPNRKKKKPVAVYMMPSRLWSTVVTQPQKPSLEDGRFRKGDGGVVLGGRSGPGAGRAGGG